MIFSPKIKTGKKKGESNLFSIYNQFKPPKIVSLLYIEYYLSSILFFVLIMWIKFGYFRMDKVR